eukprot:CAMPEP_0174370588 /NCGR_PEP_ID=MMETSP0811_2-20130205/96591_1 /TAXON_ID=73025 ORGANISM="Eutreptiella gymnastica-like, Strain CCMP1594" /NCGR_SAMPLE_ID=MMETSP0811_2 /ASSEMBLY_ACC=CAM_ASM_000667 /LENGTH=183 /DNA_ID=CAMNT_0015516125 /DNA_START=100 /DNA_END=648 /DNA_ORIENTATION=-
MVLYSEKMGVLPRKAERRNLLMRQGAVEVASRNGLELVAFDAAHPLPRRDMGRKLLSTNMKSPEPGLEIRVVVLGKLFHGLLVGLVPEQTQHILPTAPHSHRFEHPLPARRGSALGECYQAAVVLCAVCDGMQCRHDGGYSCCKAQRLHRVWQRNPRVHAKQRRASVTLPGLRLKDRCGGQHH